jgi:hypothetical protein
MGGTLNSEYAVAQQYKNLDKTALKAKFMIVLLRNSLEKCCFSLFFMYFYVFLSIFSLRIPSCPKFGNFFFTQVSIISSKMKIFELAKNKLASVDFGFWLSKIFGIQWKKVFFF